MAANKFKPNKDNEIRIDSKDKTALKNHLLKKLRIQDARTTTGKLSKGKGFPKVFIDGQQSYFRNRSGFDGFDWATQKSKTKERVARNQSLKSSPGKQPQVEIDRLKQQKADLDLMKMWDPDQGYFIEHIQKAGNFEEMTKGQGLSHFADDAPNKTINNKKWGDLKTEAEGLGDKYNSWYVDAVDDDLVFINKSMHDAHFPKEKGVTFDKSDIAAHKKFLETGSLDGATSKNKKFINYALAERAPEGLPLQEQRKTFLESVSKDENVSNTLRKKSKQNGKNGENGDYKNGKTNGKTNGKINGGALSAAGKTRKVDAIANIGLNAATGNYAGVAVGGGALAMTAALQNKQTQQAVGKQIGKLVSKRAGRTMMKAIPGLDVLLSGQESLDYLKRGKLDQAGIAALSGAIGWIPVIGDGISASLDLTNTGIDISRLQVPTGTSKKKGIIRPKSPKTRLKF